MRPPPPTRAAATRAPPPPGARRSIIGNASPAPCASASPRCTRRARACRCGRCRDRRSCPATAWCQPDAAADQLVRFSMRTGVFTMGSPCSSTTRRRLTRSATSAPRRPTRFRHPPMRFPEPVLPAACGRTRRPTSPAACSTRLNRPSGRSRNPKRPWPSAITRSGCAPGSDTSRWRRAPAGWSPLR